MSVLILGLLYFLVGLGLGAGLPYWNSGIRMLYTFAFPLHALLFAARPLGKRVLDYMLTKEKFFD